MLKHLHGHDRTFMDGQVCCQNPYHFDFQVEAECAVDGHGFDTHFRVDDLHVDPINLDLFLDPSHGRDITLNVDLGNTTNEITKTIRQHLSEMFSRVSGDQPPNGKNADKAAKASTLLPVQLR